MNGPRGLAPLGAALAVGAAAWFFTRAAPPPAVPPEPVVLASPVLHETPSEIESLMLPDENARERDLGVTPPDSRPAAADEAVIKAMTAPGPGRPQPQLKALGGNAPATPFTLGPQQLMQLAQKLLQGAQQKNAQGIELDRGPYITPFHKQPNRFIEGAQLSSMADCPIPGAYQAGAGNVSNYGPVSQYGAVQGYPSGQTAQYGAPAGYGPVSAYPAAPSSALYGPVQGYGPPPAAPAPAPGYGKVQGYGAVPNYANPRDCAGDCR